MDENRHLGGTRQSAPLADEMTYPLTQDEFLTIQENLAIDKFTNWESFLITTSVTTFISTIIFFATGTFTKVEIVDGTEVMSINMPQIIILVLYIAVSLGSFIGYLISRKNKLSNKSSVERLNTKISNHLNSK